MAKRFGTITKSKRFWFSFIVFILNLIVFTIGLYLGFDPTSMGTGLALLGTPLYGYIFGESLSPSKKVEAKEKTVTPDNER